MPDPAPTHDGDPQPSRPDADGPDRTENTSPPGSMPDNTVPIVGIGSSAGGLETLEQFLAGVPPESGMAFVVVQHLAPTHRGMFPELLQRATPMPVVADPKPVV